MTATLAAEQGGKPVSKIHSTGVRFRMKVKLHHHDINPAFKLVTDLFQNSDMPESEKFVKPDGTGIVAVTDDSDHTMSPGKPGMINKPFHQGFANAPARRIHSR